MTKRKSIGKRPEQVPPKQKVGTKNKYPTHVEPRLESIKAWRRKGLTEEQICENLGVSLASFATYKNKHPELLDALRLGKSDATAMVESALFRMACGYTYEERKTIIELPPGAMREADVKDKSLIRRRVEITTKHAVPSITAQIFYLKNRESGDWHDRVQSEVSGPGGKPLAGPAMFFFPDNGREDAKPPDDKGGS